jgi:hypothetical protein
MLSESGRRGEPTLKSLKTRKFYPLLFAKLYAIKKL